LSAGPYLHSLEVSKLRQCSTVIKNDTSTFGISCTKKLVEYEEMIVRHSSDIERIKRQATVSVAGSKSELYNADVLVITNATVLTMEGHPNGRDLIEDGILISKGGVIDWVGLAGDTIVPDGATVIDAKGGQLFSAA
jgi:hypothetical protein